VKSAISRQMGEIRRGWVERNKKGEAPVRPAFSLPFASVNRRPSVAMASAAVEPAGTSAMESTATTMNFTPTAVIGSAES
jgi:hypothetical protein